MTPPPLTKQDRERIEAFAHKRAPSDETVHIRQCLATIDQLEAELSKTRGVACSDNKCGGCVECQLRQANYYAGQLEAENARLRAVLLEFKSVQVDCGFPSLVAIAKERFDRLDAALSPTAGQEGKV